MTFIKLLGWCNGFRTRRK